MNHQDQIEIGSIGSRLGTLTFKLLSQADGKRYVSIVAYEPANLRKSPVSIWLEVSQLQMLKDLVAKVEEAIEELQNSQYQKRQQLMNHLQSLTPEQLSGVGIDPVWLV
jgi:hypothetical protein